MTNPDHEIVDNTAHWGKVTLDHCSKWQHDFNEYSDDADHTSSIWIKELITNSPSWRVTSRVVSHYLRLPWIQSSR